ncbi:Com family DNA-binding transcriptional regulator [Burkholderia thailandensis]|uniref:Com family DNA-binding transcriptional regulator n=1 Tax=pseudomallei group TaxID=111527 RepID=UPI00217CCFE2|nr:Com family DNA-binding transcriptional regulator [Burkholderia thailandensis]MCS6455066.1 Com family DNA-binding transcriptional regulator [Burkholderia thailandensis]MCS6484440.1 Com family DNA-binding transcriptional regulator [Burkholderia thailandensis]
MANSQHAPAPQSAVGALDIRCGHCRRKLATGRYIELSIKCPRCGVINHLKAESLEPARHRAPRHKELCNGRENASSG